jgi:peptidoglycan/xylan/chitin deacetylase (PgdA/CDA1 family)
VCLTTGSRGNKSTYAAHLRRLSKRLIDVLRHRRIRILAYHNVAITPADPFCVSPQAFADQMWLLAESHLPVISLEQALQALQKPAELRHSLVITLDDAYTDLLQYAIPVLLQHQFPATIYAVPGKAGRPSDWSDSSPSYPTLTLSELSRLSSLGFTIGSHTQTHPHLPALDYPAMHYELAMSKKLIHDQTGQSFISLAYPFGEFGEREKKVAHQTGYPCAVAASGLWGIGNESDIFALRRDLIMNTTNLLAFKRTIFDQNDFFLLFKDRFIRNFLRNWNYFSG